MTRSVTSMRRRDFVINAIAGSVTWPLAARAQQQSGKLPTIGFLGADVSAWDPWRAAFVARLSELGWIEGRTIAIEYRWSEGRPERVAEIGAEFVRLNVEVIVTNENAAPSVRQATSTIPIVFVLGSDPIGTGLVANLARPGGNVTGLSNQQTETADKRLALLREALPELRRLAILANVGNPSAAREMREVDAAAHTLSLQVTTLEIRRSEDIAAAFAALKSQNADALYVVQDHLVGANRSRIIIFGLAARLPMIFSSREFVQSGGLMSYGASFPAQFKRAAEYVDKILRGTKPADIPVEQPTKFELSVNVTTAKALGLTIPESFLLRADEVIE
jgi:putative ABC transport system substrate-binding protein